MRDLFFFDNMLLPKVITFFYWLLLAMAVFGGIGTIFASGFFSGISVIIGGAFAARLWCELIIVLFKINEALQEIRSR